MKYFALRMNQEDLDKLARLATTERTTVAQLIRTAVVRFLRDEEKEERDEKRNV